MRSKVKFFDMTFFSLLGFISCYLSLVFFYSEEQTNFYLNFTMLVTFLSIVRWGRSGIIVYFIATLPMYILIQDVGLLLIHNFLGTIFLLFPALVIDRIPNFKFVDQKRIGILAIISLFAFSAIGESIYSVATTGYGFFGVYQVTLAVNIFAIVMTIFVYLLLRNVPSLFYNLKEI